MLRLLWWVRELWIWIATFSATLILYPWWSSAYPYPTDLAAIGFIAACGPLTVFFILRRPRTPATPRIERRTMVTVPEVPITHRAQFRRASLHRSILWRSSAPLIKRSTQRRHL